MSVRKSPDNVRNRRYHLTGHVTSNNSALSLAMPNTDAGYSRLSALMPLPILKSTFIATSSDLLRFAVA